jgi:hypothetical protein
MASYGAAPGELTIQQMVDTTLASSRANHGAPPPARPLCAKPLLQASPGDLPSLGKLKQLDVKKLIGDNPNIVVETRNKAYDFTGPASPQCTRASNVIVPVNAVLQSYMDREDDLPEGESSLADIVRQSEDWVFYGGAETGYFHRLRTKGSRDMRNFKLPSATSAHLARIAKRFPLNRVGVVDLLGCGYKPRMETSRGLPEPSRSKRDDQSALMMFLYNTQTNRDMTALNQLDAGCLAVLKLKAELHEFSKLLTKARGYCCFPAEWSLTLGAFLCHFVKGVPHALQDRHSCNFIGSSFFYGGAAKFKQFIESATVTAPRYGVYGDDSVISTRLKSGRYFVFMPDISSMDMNTPSAYIDPWLKYLLSHHDECEEKEEEAWFEECMKAYQHCLKESRIVLPRGFICRFLNMSLTGLPANSHYQTFINIFVFTVVMEREIVEACQASEEDASLEADQALVDALERKLRKLQNDCAGMPWKESKGFEHYTGTKIAGFLGHQFLFEDPHPRVSIAPHKLLASLINPRGKPSKSATAVFIAYGRGIALAIAGGYCFPWFLEIIDALYQRCLELAKISPIQLKQALSGLVCTSQLGESVEQRISICPCSLVGTDLVMDVPPPFTFYSKLREEPEEGEVADVAAAIKEQSAPAAAAAPVRRRKQPFAPLPRVQPVRPPGSSKAKPAAKAKAKSQKGAKRRKGGKPSSSSKPKPRRDQSPDRSPSPDRRMTRSRSRSKA